jgi:hypothetical protein
MICIRASSTITGFGAVASDLAMLFASATVPLDRGVALLTGGVGDATLGAGPDGKAISGCTA